MKKRTLKNRILIFLFLPFGLCFSQNVIKYNYVVNGVLDNSKPHLGMESEFSTIRKYYTDKKFKESRLFTGSNNDFIVYKILDQAWYYKSKNKWNLFFDCTTKQGGQIRLFGIDYKIVLKKEIIIRDKRIFKIYFQPINSSITHQPVYYFDSNEGIIIFKTASGIILIRNDYFRNQLTEDEINLL
jgi:hypothetical protein